MKTPLAPRFVSLAFFVLLSSFAHAEEAAPILNSARAVRELNAKEANEGRSVQFSGIVLGLLEPFGLSLVVKDQTDPIYLVGPSDEIIELQPGDMVKVHGKSAAGGFAPYVIADKVEKTGTDKLPPPTRVSAEDLFTKGLDAQWVLVHGVVRETRQLRPDELPRGPMPGADVAGPQPPHAENERVKLVLAVGDRLLTVQLNGSIPPDLHVDAEVEICGICVNQHNTERQFLNPVIVVPRGVKVTVLLPSDPDPFAGKIVASTSLFQFARGGISNHLVHVSGVVLHQELGTGLWIRDDDHGIFVQSDQRDALLPGDRVEVAGFPERGPFAPILSQAIFRKTDRAVEPPPFVVENRAGAMNHNGDLISVTGTLLSRKDDDTHRILRLDVHGSEIAATCALGDFKTSDQRLEIGSQLRVVGVCVVSSERLAPLTGLLTPDTYHLLVRNRFDVTLVKAAPWMTGTWWARVMAGLALALAIVLTSVFLVSRRHIAKERALRGMEAAEYSVRLAERSRMARELHDTVAQALGAISIQLELAGSAEIPETEESKSHISVAHRLVRSALIEVRSFIRNLRTQTQQDVELAKALEEFLHNSVADTTIQSSFQIEGEVEKLSPVAEAQIIRIAQEAITNAVRHSGGTSLTVHINHTATKVILTVTDNGRGFDHRMDWSSHGHFGLVGMQERAGLIESTLKVEPCSDGGTRVVLVVPRHAESTGEKNHDHQRKHETRAYT